MDPFVKVQALIECDMILLDIVNTMLLNAVESKLEGAEEALQEFKNEALL